jgi:hypothetical protein
MQTLRRNVRLVSSNVKYFKFLSSFDHEEKLYLFSKFLFSLVTKSINTAIERQISCSPFLLVRTGLHLSPFL